VHNALSPSTFVGGVENNGSLRRRGENFADLWSSDDRAPYTNQTWGEANEKEKIHFFVSKNENPKSTLENPKMGGKACWKKLPLGTSWFLRFSINCASHLSILVQERSWSKTQDHCPYTQGNGMETYIGKIERAGKRHGMQWSGVRIHARSNSTQGMSMLEASNCKISFSKFNTGNMSTSIRAMPACITKLGELGRSDACVVYRVRHGLAAFVHRLAPH